MNRRLNVVFLLFAAGMLALGSRAQAYTLFDDGRDTNRHWPDPPLVEFYLNEDGSDDVPIGVLEQILQAAVAEWTNAGDTPLVFSYMGQTALRNDFEGTSVISWDETGEFFASQSVTGITLTRVDPRNGEIIEADVIINGVANVWTATDEEGLLDIQSVLTHEAGHMLGLDHSAHRACTMYYRMTPVGLGLDPGTRKRTLSADDVAGLEDLYGTGAGKGTIAGTIDSDLGGQGMIVGAVHSVTGDTYTGVCGVRGGQNNEDYEIRSLPPGTYTVFAFPVDDVEFGMVADGFSDLFTDIDDVFRPRFYTSSDPTGTADPAMATPVVVQAGAVTSGVSIDPPDDPVSANLYYTSLSDEWDSAAGATLAAPEQAFIFGFSLEEASPSVLGPASNAISPSTETGFSWIEAGQNQEDVFILESTAQIEEGKRGANLTLFIRHTAGAEVDFLPGSLELAFQPVLTVVKAVAGTVPSWASADTNDDVVLDVGDVLAARQ